MKEKERRERKGRERNVLRNNYNIRSNGTQKSVIHKKRRKKKKREKEEEGESF